MKKLYIVLFCFVGLNSFLAQQDPQYNLYQFNPIIINPAYAGSRDAISTNANIRSQWVGVDGAPKTTVLSVHGPVLNKHIGIGMTMLSDKLGPRDLFGVAGNFAYMLKLSNQWKLSFGLSAGYNRYQFNYRDLKFKTVDQTSLGLTVNRGSMDVNSGLYLRSKTFFVGLSTTHLGSKQLFEIDLKDTSSKNTNLTYSLKHHTFLYIGKSFMLNENVVFSPTILLRSVKGGKGNVDVNFNFFLYKKIWLGVFIRGAYGTGFLINYYVSPKFKLGYSFDSGGRDSRSLGASHEVSIGFDFINNKSKIISPRFL